MDMEFNEEIDPMLLLNIGCHAFVVGTLVELCHMDVGDASVGGWNITARRRRNGRLHFMLGIMDECAFRLSQQTLEERRTYISDVYARIELLSGRSCL